MKEVSYELYVAVENSDVRTLCFVTKDLKDMRHRYELLKEGFEERGDNMYLLVMEVERNPILLL